MRTYREAARPIALACLFFATGCNSQPAATVATTAKAPPHVEDPSNSKMPAAENIRIEAKAKGKLPIPQFVDFTRESGVNFERYDDTTGLHRIVEANGGGVAIFDYDGDGRVDVLLTNGCALPRQPDDQTHASRLYRNRGGARFEEVSGVTQFGFYGYGHGVAAADFNDDGFDDFYIAAYGENALWQNNGDGTFSNVTHLGNVDDTRWSSSAAFADFDSDGDLDLFVVNYVDPGNPITECPNKASPDGRMQCSPTIFPGVDDRLFLNDGTGQFTDVTVQAGIVGVDGKGLSLVVFDADLDGRPDIFITNDGTPNFLYINRGNRELQSGDSTSLQFEEQAFSAAVALNREGKAEGCMGIACGDCDGDGLSELFVTNFFAETNTYYHNLANLSFKDDTNRSRLGPPSRNMVGFGTDFIDFDNDGWLDLMVANGHVDAFPWATTEEQYQMLPQFFRNSRRGSFTDVSGEAGGYFTKKHLGRGLAVADLDNDGTPDLVISHQRERSAILLNRTSERGNSVVIKCIGTNSNRSAVNARLVATSSAGTFTREIIGGGSFQASGDRRVHFGIGNDERIDELTINWPSGKTDVHKQIDAGQYVAIEQHEPGLIAAPPCK